MINILAPQSFEYLYEISFCEVGSKKTIYKIFMSDIYNFQEKDTPSDLHWYTAKVKKKREKENTFILW